MRDTVTSARVQGMKRKRRVSLIRKVVLISLLIISVIGGFGYFSSHPRVTLSNIVINGTSIINSSDVETLVQDNITGKYLHIFAKSNSFIYPKKQIFNNILNQFPRIEKLTVYRENLNILRVDIVERGGAYLYCGAFIPEIQTDIGENCYFINNNGYVFDRAPYFSGNVYFKYYIEIIDADSSKPLGVQILPKEKFHKLVRFVDGVTELGFRPIYVAIDKDGIGSLYLHQRNNSVPPKIIFKNDDSLETMLDNLSISMAQKEFANEINSKYNTLLYLDLRFNNKVIYKFHD